MVVDEAHDPRGDNARDESDGQADRHGPGEGDDGLGRTDRRADRADRDGEQDQAGPVVEQALAVDHRGQRLRDPQALEGRNHGGRIGRRHHRADDERQIQPQTGPDIEQERHDRGRDQDAGDRQKREAAEPAPKLADPEAVRRLEHEPRQEDEKDDLGGDVDGRVPDGVRADPDEEAGDDQGHRIGESQRSSDDRDERRQAEQADQQLDRVRDRRLVHQAVTGIGESSPGRPGLPYVDALEDA